MRRAKVDDRALVARVEERLAPFRKVLIAVSGGPDSIALLNLAALARPPSTLHVHSFDHALRHASADEVGAVARASSALGIGHSMDRWGDPDKEASGLQERARQARYASLLQAARAHGASAIATAHTAGDQAETVLMRLCRGSGLAGLSGMAMVTGLSGDVSLVRPLLDTPKADLIAYLSRHGIEYVTDPSNSDLRFLRPRLRAIMPAFAAEGFDNTRALAFSHQMARANAAIEALAGDLVLAWQTDGHLPIERYSSAPSELRIRCLARVIEGSLTGTRPPSDAELERLDQRLVGGARKAMLANLIFEAIHGALSARPAPPRKPVSPRAARPR